MRKSCFQSYEQILQFVPPSCVDRVMMIIWFINGPSLMYLYPWLMSSQSIVNIIEKRIRTYLLIDYSTYADQKNWTSNNFTHNTGNKWNWCRRKCYENLSCEDGEKKIIKNVNCSSIKIPSTCSFLYFLF